MIDRTENAHSREAVLERYRSLIDTQTKERRKRIERELNYKDIENSGEKIRKKTSTYNRFKIK